MTPGGVYSPKCVEGAFCEVRLDYALEYFIDNTQ
jgi:hypothetical protein